MYAGYQNEKIVLTADTQEELANNKFMVFDKIEELSEPYELYNGEYISSAEAAIRRAEDEKQAQIKALQEQLDTLDLKAIRALRAIQAGTGTEADQTKLSELEEEAGDVRRRIQELQEEDEPIVESELLDD